MLVIVLCRKPWAFQLVVDYLRRESLLASRVSFNVGLAR